MQLPGTFIELLGLTDTSGIVPHAARQFSFGAFNRDFLAGGEGLSMLVLEGRGACDADEFRTRGIGDFELYEFEREGKRPDGTAIKVAFALSFASDPLAPETGFLTCQQRYPENFWNLAFRKHANGAESVTGVVLVAKNPAQHRDFLLAFSGAPSAHDTGDGLAISLPRGMIEVMKPERFRRQFGVEPPVISYGARLAATCFGVRDIASAARALHRCGVYAPLQNGRLVVGPLMAHGAILIFEGQVGC